MHEVIVIGGGAGGMMAALHAARTGAQVTLLERNQKLGRKVYITGKGRCNVTNDCTLDEFMREVPRNPRFLYSALSYFGPREMMELLEDNGCPVVVQRGRRVFPATEKASDVTRTLERMLREIGVRIVFDARVKGVDTRDGAVAGVTLLDGTQLPCDRVIIATGGLSCPLTGSTGDGYRMAEELGHTVTPRSAVLSAIETVESWPGELQGLSLRNCGVKLLNAKGKVLYKDFGELLFTHFGVSGPTVLSASCHLKGEGCRLVIDLKPALEENKLDERIQRDLEMYKNRSMENALTDLLPRSMIPVVLRRLEIDANMQANSLTKQKRRSLVELLKAFSLEITGKRPVAEAIITSGGVKVSEIDPKTMESKLVPGLYFAGEIIDCDAYTGGFNLQIAWATAYAAGMAVK